MDDRTKDIGKEMTTGRTDSPNRPGTAYVPDRQHARTPRTNQIRSEIEQTRDDMSDTIDEIQDRLRPGNVAANVRDTASIAASNVRSAARETMDEVAESRVVQQLRANPIPGAMVGIGVAGLAWLAFGSRDDRWRPPQGRRFASGPYGRTAASAGIETAVEGAVDRAKELTSKTGEYAREVGWKAQQTTRRAQTQLQQTTRRAQTRLQRAINENPLFIGAAALAAGAMIGMAVPETERENEWMGETRDNVVEEAQHVARHAANRVQGAATDAAKRVQNVVTDPVGLLSKDE
jgi:hypothetical protein